MNIIKSIEEKITNSIAPQYLQIIDDSAKHKGHEGLPEEMQVSHVGIIIVSEKFSGVSRVERARMVHKIIADEIRQIHAITILKTLDPQEFAKNQPATSNQQPTTT